MQVDFKHVIIGQLTENNAILQAECADLKTKVQELSAQLARAANGPAVEAPTKPQKSKK